MDLGMLYRRTMECWAVRVNAVGDDHWDNPTPCTEWTVRDVVNHVVGEDRWTVPLMRGRTIADVGDSLDGDLVGDHPIVAALAAAAEAESTVVEMLPVGGKVNLSYGEEDMGEYVRQLAADHLVHAWDIAAATGGDTRLETALVVEVARWFAGREEVYRSAGAIGPRASLTGDAQHDLLAGFGRSADWGPNHAALARFSAAFGRGDVEAIMGLMTDDCVFESTGPAPDGVRHEGASDVRRVWAELFEKTTDAAFTEEESFVCGDRAVLRWRFTWTEPDGSPGGVRGADVLRLRGGKVAEKLSYVKG
ncbi:MAG TPA: TIGR03086 family metal-binding protein [Nocardioidaceae bacterium]|nr:TIGR03086 family metal-binding protein [Nocardioidaceae bacterium]